jgi:glycosyltransferase involved in cell wall biosynthesis
MTLAPIALFTYNRPIHTRKTIEALQKNKLANQSDLIIFSDGPNESISGQLVEDVRNYLKSIQHFKSVRIVEREKNYGLSFNIMEGVQQIISEYGKVIVLEDDLETSPFFLDYMNEGLYLYQNDENVISIMGYLYPMDKKLPETFFIRGADCLGWATWKRGWDLFQPDGKVLLKKLIESKQTNEFEFEGSYPFMQMLMDQIAGKTNSWAIRWHASAFLANKFTLYPGKSLLSNIGADGSGTNNGFEHSAPAPLNPDPIKISRIEVCQNAEAYQAFASYYRKITHPPLWNKIRRRIRIVMNKYLKAN